MNVCIIFYYVSLDFITVVVFCIVLCPDTLALYENGFSTYGELSFTSWKMDKPVLYIAILYNLRSI